MRRIAIAFGFLLLPPALLAWTVESELRIAKKASQLAPPDLKVLLEKFEKHYQKGLIAALDDEKNAQHQFISSSGRGLLRSALEREIVETTAMLRARQPMESVIERLGGIVHLVGDANNPLHVITGESRLEPSHYDFEKYFERRLRVFPTVFYGLDSNFELRPYLDKTLARAGSLNPILNEEYFRDGDRRHSSAFDDRSSAFGIAALSYSHSVTDAVNIFYFIWKEAGGDVRAARSLRRGNLFVNENAP